MGLYTNKGLYNSYDKNHKERQAEDYYATPPKEVTNILNILNYDFSNQSILEPCAGGGHMASGIDSYLSAARISNVKKMATDIKDRGFKNATWETQYGLDFFADDYPKSKADWVIMNPPFSVIEPFTIRALEIAEKGVIMLARLQFLEGNGRYETIFKNNPPTDIYVYIDRIQCWRDGVEPTGSSAQAYCWVIWDKSKQQAPQVHWLRRAAN